MKDVIDVIFADEDEARNAFANGFAWGCAATAALCLVIVALTATLGS